MVALVLSLGIDTLMVSVSLGLARVTGVWRVALTFAVAEALMPLFGLCIGRAAGQWMGTWGSLVGGVLLLAVAAWLLLFENDEVQGQLGGSVAGWTLLVAALSISIDEFAVGFSIGVVGVPIAWTIGLIALQSCVFTWLGFAFARRLQPVLGEWAEKLAGVVLGILGVWVLVEAVWHG